MDPLFGTMEEFEQLLELAHSLGLRVLLDVVPNHSSSAHPLFQQALAAGKGSPERDMFHFVEGPDDGGTCRVEDENLLNCERGPDFFVAITVGTEPVRLPAGSVLISAVPQRRDGRLEPDNAACVQRS